MNPDGNTLSKQYAAALTEYLADPESEIALNKAYEIGRDAINVGMGVLDMVTLYHDALCHVIAQQPAAMHQGQIAAAATFFAENLSSFEMQLRGYRENNVLLQEGNEMLRQAKTHAEDAHRELQQTQAQLVHAAKMASLGELVAGIAHELNNPLTFVIANRATVSKLIGELAASPNFPPDLGNNLTKVQDRLDRMRTGFGRITDIVLNLRTFSRLDEGEFKLIRVNQSLDSVLMLLEHRLAGRISIVKQYCADDMLFCMPGIFNQVVMNLLTNAIDAIDGEGAISLSTSRGETAFQIDVADTGAGIPPAVLSRIFEPFFTTKPVGAGTGLGLAIAHSIVQAHKGAITVASEAGRGTTFTVSIPYAAFPLSTPEA
ncbi:MAG: hybrid sensor histidine kinase/response regulator [Rhodospirillales bacterium]|nr:hybrid sensor histidine kinase/response regulator [Rhodospirillales bacterium]